MLYRASQRVGSCQWRRGGVNTLPEGFDPPTLHHTGKKKKDLLGDPFFLWGVKVTKKFDTRALHHSPF